MPRAPKSTLSLDSDRDLVVAFQQGSRDAYDEIYRRYENRVRRICGRILHNTQDIDEATQETFLKAYQALGRFNGSYQLGAWLSRIASNVCVDHVRCKVRSAQLVSLAPEHETLGTEGGPEDVVVGSNPRIDAAIHRLAPLHAEALKLRALGGLSHEEMAGRLEMSPAQVKALLHRARTSFKKAWDKAEGWALAPFVGIRNWFSERSESSTAGNLLGAGPAFGPLFAERVATSAVIVVVALSGVPSTSAVAPDSGDTIAAPPAVVDVGPSARAARAAREEAAAAPAPAEGHALLPKVALLLGHAQDTLEPGEDHEPGDDPPDGGVGPAETRDVVKKARKAARELSDNLEVGALPR